VVRPETDDGTARLAPQRDPDARAERAITQDAVADLRAAPRFRRHARPRDPGDG